MSNRREPSRGVHYCSFCNYNGTFLALMLFVGIPLPGTGAWTGTLAASILDIDFKSTVVAVSFGVLLAGIIMMTLSYVGFGFLFG